MRKLVYILFVFCLAAGCSEKPVVPEFQDVPEGMVRVDFRLPGIFSPIPDDGSPKSRAGEYAFPETRTVAANDTILNRKLKHPDPNQPVPIPYGSTVWISYVEGSSTYDAKGNIITTYDEEPKYHACVVRADAGYNSLYPLNVKDTTIVVNGVEETFITPERETLGRPLLLTDQSKYRFKMMYPALPVHKTKKSIIVENGMFFCAHDGRYEETAPTDTKVSKENSGVAYVSLNPVVHQTSRFHFRIRAGANVTDLAPLHTGVEVTGLQTPGVNWKYDDKGNNLGFDPESTSGYIEYKWPSMDIADTLEMKMGDKYSWTHVYGDSKYASMGTYYDEESGLNKKMLEADVYFLPTNAQSSSVVVLFNLLLNGIPTQFMVTISQSATFTNIFKHAHSYNLDMTVSRKEGITVITWQNQSWVADMVMSPKNS